MRTTAISAAATVAGVLAALAGCGSAAHPTAAVTPTPTSSAAAPSVGAPASTAAPGSTRAPAATAPVLPRCTTAVLAMGLGPANGAAGSSYLPLRLTNRGAASCELTGYPGVSYQAAAGGPQVGRAAGRDSSHPVVQVVLAHGQTANATLRLTDPGDYPPADCRMSAYAGLRVYPPGSTVSAYLAHPGSTCSSTSLTLLFTTAVAAGAG